MTIQILEYFPLIFPMHTFFILYFWVRLNKFLPGELIEWHLLSQNNQNAHVHNYIQNQCQGVNWVECVHPCYEKKRISINVKGLNTLAYHSEHCIYLIFFNIMIKTHFLTASNCNFEITAPFQWKHRPKYSGKSMLQHRILDTE